MKPERKILLVEDDESLGSTLKDRLAKDFSVTWVVSKKQALEKLDSSIDLIILDVGLPDGSGFDILTEYKGTHRPSVVFLTAQSDAESRLKGYELGAEEYIPKPFHLKELLLRVTHVLDSHVPQNTVQFKTSTIDFTTMSIRQASGEIAYPSLTDMKVLKILVEQAPRPVSRDEIINLVWGEEKETSHRTVDNVIVRLKKILGPDGEKAIRSVRGVGYQWVPEGEG